MFSQHPEIAKRFAAETPDIKALPQRVSQPRSGRDRLAGEYVRGNATTNQVENFFSQLKRSIDGTHHHVSVEHLHRYLAEFAFRYNTCKISDEARMQMLVGRVGGRRLTYKQPRAHG